jgi:hypothetical protein
MSNLQQQNQRKAIIEQDKLNRQTPFDPLVSFDSKGLPIYERNPRWHTNDGYYIGRPMS